MGGAYIAMSSKQMRTDLAYAWPTAEIAVMGPEGAINVLYRRELAKAEDREALRKKLLQEYIDKFHNPYAAADVGQIDEVIEPSYTRLRLVNALEILRSKVATNPPKKHGLMPL
jgi:acetyl-CoA carboxylase carboxyltransferase component